MESGYRTKLNSQVSNDTTDSFSCKVIWPVFANETVFYGYGAFIERVIGHLCQQLSFYTSYLEDQVLSYIPINQVDAHNLFLFYINFFSCWTQVINDSGYAYIVYCIICIGIRLFFERLLYRQQFTFMYKLFSPKCVELHENIVTI